VVSPFCVQIVLFAGVRGDRSLEEMRKGNELYRGGDLDGALRHYQMAVKVNPKNEVAWNNLGIIMRKKGRYQEALKYHERALAINKNYKEAWCQKGIVLIKLRKYSDAMKCFNRALKIDPNYKDALNNKGNLLVEMGEYEKALGCYNTALSIDPEYIKAWNNKGRALLDMGRYEQALAHFDKALTISKNYPEIWYNRGRALLKLGRYEEAIDAFNKAISLKKDFKPAIEAKKLAEKEMQRGLRDEEILREAVGVGTGEGRVPATGMGKVGRTGDKATAGAGVSGGARVYGRKRRAQAVETGGVAGGRRPRPLTPDVSARSLAKKKTVPAKHPIGKEAAGRAGRGSEKTPAILKGIDLTPKETIREGARGKAEAPAGMEKEEVTRGTVPMETGDAGAGVGGEEKAGVDAVAEFDFQEAISRAKRKIKEKDYEGALRELDRAIAIINNRELPWHLRGMVLFRLGREKEAVESFAEAIRINPRSTEAWFSLGRCLEDRGKYDDALKAFNKILEFDPDNVDALFEKGYLLREADLLEDALDVYNRILEIDPEDLDAMFEKAGILFDLGRLDEALETYNAILEKDPEDADSYFERGNVYFEMKELEKARADYEKAMELDPKFEEARENLQICVRAIEKRKKKRGA